MQYLRVVEEAGVVDQQHQEQCYMNHVWPFPVLTS
jgi:hypothetical protein